MIIIGLGGVNLYDNGMANSLSNVLSFDRLHRDRAPTLFNRIVPLACPLNGRLLEVYDHKKKKNIYIYI